MNNTKFKENESTKSTEITETKSKENKISKDILDEIIEIPYYIRSYW